MNTCLHWPSCANHAPVMVYLLKMNSALSNEQSARPAPERPPPQPPPREGSASASFYVAAMGPGGGGGTTATRSDRAPAVSWAQRVVGVGKGEATSNATGRGQVVLGVAPPPSGGARARVGDAPAVSGPSRVVVGGKSKGKGTSAGPKQVVLGVAPPPSGGARARVGDAPAVSGPSRVVVGGKSKGKGTTAGPEQVVLGVAPHPLPPPPLARAQGGVGTQVVVPRASTHSGEVGAHSGAAGTGGTLSLSPSPPLSRRVGGRTPRDEGRSPQGRNPGQGPRVG